MYPCSADASAPCAHVRVSLLSLQGTVMRCNVQRASKLRAREGLKEITRNTLLNQ